MKSLILFSLMFILPVSGLADELGRLFTTPAQRAMLEKLRNTKPVREEPIVQQYEPVEVIEEQLLEEVVELEEVEEEVPILEQPISLKGVVKRSNRANTAWINRNNTYEGGMMEENISIKNRDIQTDRVRVKLPDQVTNITLRVGETYAPEVSEETEELQN